MGATQTLARAAGGQRAKEIILTGRPFTADEALAWGVASQVCAPERLLDEALETAVRIAANAPLAVKAIKHAIDAGAGRPLREAMQIELEQYNRLFTTHDRVEGVRAFNEKRKPRFSGE